MMRDTLYASGVKGRNEALLDAVLVNGFGQITINSIILVIKLLPLLYRIVKHS